MLRTTLLYGSLVLFSVLVGVFIGGGPGALRSSEAIAPVPSTATTTTTTTTTTTIAPASTSSTTIEPATTTTEAAVTTLATTTTTLAATTTTEAPPELIERGALSVAVANGAGVQGIAGRVAGDLVAIGYVDPEPINAQRRDVTTVFHAPGLELEAARLAEDAGFGPDAIGPSSDAPAGLPADKDLVLLLGEDNQSPAPAPATDPPQLDG